METEGSTTDQGGELGNAAAGGESTTAAPAQGAASSQEGQAAAAFTPDFKFKVWKDEREVDQDFRPLIKDADSEKRIKTLLSKAYGMDKFVEERDKLRGDYDGYKGQAEPVMQQVKKINEYLNSGTIDGAYRGIRELNVPDELLLQVASFIMKRNEMPADQRAVLERNERLARENEELKSKFDSTDGEAAQLKRQTSLLQIDAELTKPSVKPIADAFEADHGHGSFRDEVIQAGYRLEAANPGKTIPFDEAVQAAVTRWSRYYGGQAQNQGVAPTVPVQQGQGQPPAKKPNIIPHVPGGGASPAMRSISSINDIRKLANERAG